MRGFSFVCRVVPNCNFDFSNPTDVVIWIRRLQQSNMASIVALIDVYRMKLYLHVGYGVGREHVTYI